MITEGAFDAPAGVVELAEDHVPRNPAACDRVVRRPILCPAEQHVPGILSANPGQKAPSGRAKGQSDPLFSACAHQSGGRAGIGKGNDSLQRVKGVAGNGLFFPIGDHILSIQCEVDVLPGYEQHVEQLLHGFSSIAFFR